MPGDSITVFYGEFMTSVTPTELSLNYCSHACPYCFANLNSEVRRDRDGVPLRYADVKNIVNLIRDCHKRDSLEAYWLRNNYPVLISNKVDPFANSNYRQALPIMETLAALDKPMAIQTKGGRGIDDALEFMAPSVWYITIEMQDDEICRRIEPAAPSIESRFELIAKLRDKGHQVVIGMNPLTIEWMPHPERILQRCKDLGAWGVWIEMLHFNREQAAIAHNNGVLPPEMIDRYKIKKFDAEVFGHFVRTRAIARDIGLETFSQGQGIYSNYFGVYRDTYEHTIPNLQDWVNHCHDSGWDGSRLISFQEYLDFFLSKLPVFQSPQRLGHYIGSTAHQIPRQLGKKWSNWMDWRELLRWAWTDDRVKFNPVNCPPFAYVADNGGKILKDGQGYPYISFWPEHTEFIEE